MPRHAAHFRLKLRGPFYQVRFTRKGVEHRRSCETGDQARAREEAARLVLEHDAGTDCAICGGGGASVQGSTRELAEQFLKAVKRSHGEGYAKRAATDLHQYIIDRWPSPDLITSKAWEATKVDLHERKTEGEEGLDRRERLSWGSVANLANTMRGFLRYCASVGAVESVPEVKNPTAKQLAGDRAYLRPLDADEQGAFLWALAIEGEGRALRIYIALFETWLRKGALAAMTPRWVNFAREHIRIPSAYTKAQRGDLEIDLTPRAAEAILAEMEESRVEGRERTAYQNSGGASRHDGSDQGHSEHLREPPHSDRDAAGVARLDEQAVISIAASRESLDRPIFGAFDYRALFPRIAEAAGIDLTGLTAHHVTRRTAATLAGEKPGASLAALKSQGGWRTSSVVDLYMKPSVEAARKVTR